MTCFKRPAHLLMALPSWWLLSFLFIGSSCVASTDGGNSSQTQQLSIYDLTLCELNGTKWVTSWFPYAVETFVVYPIITHAISVWFLTTGHFLDSIGLALVAAAGYNDNKYIVTSLFAIAAFAAFVCFCIRFVKNVWSWRYACTRYTNYVLDTSGRVWRWKSPILLQRNGRIDLGVALVEPKKVVIEGVEATKVVSVQAERWAPA